jgi:hypothetical protein
VKHTILSVLLAFLAVALVAPAADAGKKAVKVKIKKPTPVVAGLVWSYTETIKVDAVATTTSMGNFPITETKTLTTRVEILEASDDKIDRVQVTYDALPSGDVRATTPYVIEASSSGPRVTAADGRQLGAEEVKKVMESHGELVRRTPLRSWLIGKTFKKGKKVKIGDDAMLDLFSADADYRAQKMTITLVSATKKVASFRFEGTFTMSGTDEGVDGELSGAATGTFEVDLRRGLLQALDLSMSMDGSFTASGQSFTIKGTVDADRAFTYTDPQ